MPPRPASEQARSDLDLALCGDDQTRSDTDQTTSDADQTASDLDQGAAEADQDAADGDEDAAIRDQAAADRDQAHGSTNGETDRAYDVSRDERADASAERETSTMIRAAAALARTRASSERDESARLRDVTADVRDRATQWRDRAAERRDDPARRGAAQNGAARAAHVESAADVRTRASSDRSRAAADRRRAADDRSRAADDRRQARVDLESAHFDELTGAYARGMGLLTLRHEIERAHRLRHAVVLACIDVDVAAKTGDSARHATGDGALRAVADLLRSRLRSYDPIVRIGADRFLCAFTSTRLQTGVERLQEIRAALERDPVGGWIGCGLAELRPDESLEDLIARADADLTQSERIAAQDASRGVGS